MLTPLHPQELNAYSFEVLTITKFTMLNINIDCLLENSTIIDPNISHGQFFKKKSHLTCCLVKFGFEKHSPLNIFGSNITELSHEQVVFILK